MQNLVVVGLQWGDEGKGKLVDYLSEQFDIVVRFQGGSNAGHTVKVGDDVFKLRIMPTGAIRGKKAVIGNGVVVDPKVLLEEIESLKGSGIAVDLLISDRAHVITPFQIYEDKLQETARANDKISTTKRGIGPTYSDKISRVGLRICDFISEDGEEKWGDFSEHFRQKLSSLYGKDASEFETYDILRKMKSLSSYVADCGDYLNSMMSKGERILFEGAQGTLLDIDHGTYPYVTSSNCISAAAATGSGIAPSMIGDVLGITKAYMTRVGSGPFPTELVDEYGKALQERGNEFGTVTERPRRCGWLDLVALRYAVRLNGVKYLAVTKADVLSNFETIKVCTSYSINGCVSTTYPAGESEFSELQPVYEEFESWSSENILELMSGFDGNFESLPKPLFNYIDAIQKFTGVEVSMISIGPERSATLVRQDFQP